MRAAILAAVALVLVGCGVALAQTAPGIVAVHAADAIPWGAIVGALGIIGTAIGGAAKVLHDLLAAFHRAIGSLDARAAAFEAVVKDGFNNGIQRLDRIEAEQRRSADAALLTAERVDRVESDVSAIHARLDDVTEERAKRRSGH